MTKYKMMKNKKLVIKLKMMTTEIFRKFKNSK